MRRFLWAFFLPTLACLCAASEPDSKPELKRTLGIGFAYTGGLVRWGFRKVWSVEGHYLFGSADSNDGGVSADVMGARGYRHFRVQNHLQFYAGTEAGYLTASGAHLKTRGFLVGGFAGMEYYLRPWLSVG